ncbi:MAG TPA: hypothetical protein VI297_00325, partial [Gemmatimonadales bacterium]
MDTKPRIEWMPLTYLRSILLPDNPKAHDLEGTIATIRRFGFLDWPQIDETSGKLCVGNGRVEALAAMRNAFEDPPKNIEIGDGGEWLVPVTRGNALPNAEELTAYVIAHNKLTMAGGWRFETLTEQLRRMRERAAAAAEESGGDASAARERSTTGIGFNRGELDALVGRFADRGFAAITGGMRAGPPPQREPWDEPDPDDRDPVPGERDERARSSAARDEEGDGDRDPGSPGPMPARAFPVGEVPVPDELPKRAVTKPGTTWILGEHRLVCGDMLVPEVMAAALAGRQPAMLWTQPPDDEAVEAARRKRKAPTVQPAIFGFMAALERACPPGAPGYVMAMPDDMELLSAAAKEASWSWSSTIIWLQQSPVQRRRDYAAQYQPMWYGWRAGAPRLCAPTDRTLSDVWSFDR